MAILGIYIMATITVLVSAVTWGGLIYSISNHNSRYLWLLLLGLPLSAVVNVAVKQPLAISVGHLTGVIPQLGLAIPWWFLLFLFMLAPLFEEAIKVVPLILPPVRHLLANAETALLVGMMLGISFGLGEAIFIAYGIVQIPAYASLQWYLFTGYAIERWIVCFLHGVMTAIFVLGLQRGGRWAAFGYLGAVGLHALFNIGAMLYQLGVASLTVAALSVYGDFVIALLIFATLLQKVSQKTRTSEQTSDVVNPP
jgi:uncharacterized membrane protein YhfC